VAVAILRTNQLLPISPRGQVGRQATPVHRRTAPCDNPAHHLLTVEHSPPWQQWVKARHPKASPLRT
jgi:hypothetical protein